MQASKPQAQPVLLVRHEAGLDAKNHVVMEAKMIKGDYPRTGGGSCFYDACKAAGLDYPIDGSKLHPDCLKFLESHGYTVIQGVQEIEIESENPTFLFFGRKDGSGGHCEFLKSLSGLEDELENLEDYYLFAAAFKGEL